VILHRQWSPEFQESWKLFLCTAVTLGTWALLLFGPHGTGVWVGSYFTEIAAFTAGILALWGLSPTLAVLFGGAHIVLNCVTFIFVNPPQVIGLDTFVSPSNGILGCAAALTAFAFLAVSWRTTPDRTISKQPASCSDFNTFSTSGTSH